jgi:hypothetical protein
MTSHLTLDELIGTPAGDREAVDRAHLADCPRCRAEAAAWAAIGEGVRHRATATRPPSRQAALRRIDGGTVAAPPAGTVAAAVRFRGRRTVLAAAAAVVLAAGGYGLAGGFSRAGHTARNGPSAPAELTATGCSGLELAGGMLRSADGRTLVIGANGTDLTVATSVSTSILREVVGSIRDITGGAHVLVTGIASGGTLRARFVGVLPASVTAPAAPGSGGLSIGLAAGTVTDAGKSGFTVVEQDGTRARVDMSSSVAVVTTVRASVSQLDIGAVTSAVGSAGSDGTVIASTVEQDAVPASVWGKARPPAPSVPAGLPTIGAPSVKPDLALNGLGCASTSVATAYLMNKHV